MTTFERWRYEVQLVVLDGVARLRGERGDVGDKVLLSSDELILDGLIINLGAHDVSQKELNKT